MTDNNGRPFWRQLRERKVIRAAIAYIIVGWVVLQVGEVVFEPLALPDWSLKLLIVLVFLGFPIAMVLSWAFEFSTSGIRRDPAGQVESVEQITPEPGAPSIAVLPFDDMSERGDQAYFCEGMAEEIMNALVHVDGIRVASRTSTFKAV